MTNRERDRQTESSFEQSISLAVAGGRVGKGGHRSTGAISDLISLMVGQGDMRKLRWIACDGS